MEEKWKPLTVKTPPKKLIDEFKQLPDASKKTTIRNRLCWRLLINLTDALGVKTLAALVKDNVNFQPIARIYLEGSMGAKSAEIIPTIAQLFDADESIAKQIIDCEELRFAICTELNSFYAAAAPVAAAALMNRKFFEQFYKFKVFDDVTICYQHKLSLQQLLDYVKSCRFLDKKILSEVRLEDIVILLKADPAYVEAFKSLKPEEIMAKDEAWQRIARAPREVPVSNVNLLLTALEESKRIQHAVDIIDIFQVPHDSTVERLFLAYIESLINKRQFEAAKNYCLKLPDSCAQKKSLSERASHELQKENMWLMIINREIEKLIALYDKVALEKLLNEILKELSERTTRPPADRLPLDKMFLRILDLMQALYPGFDFKTVPVLERVTVQAFINTGLALKSLTDPALFRRLISIFIFQRSLDNFDTSPYSSSQFDRLISCSEYLVRQVATFLQIPNNDVWKFLQEIFPQKESGNLREYLKLIYLMEKGEDYLKILVDINGQGNYRLMSQVAIILAEQLFAHSLYMAKGKQWEPGNEKNAKPYFFIAMPMPTNDMESTAVTQACWAFEHVRLALSFVIDTDLAVKSRALDLYRQILAILSGKSIATVDMPQPTLETPVIMTSEIFIEFVEYYLIKSPKLLGDFLKNKRLPLPSDLFQTTPEAKIKELVTDARNEGCIELAHVLEMQGQVFRHQQERAKDAEMIKDLQEKLATLIEENRKLKEREKDEKEPSDKLSVVEEGENLTRHQRTSSYPSFDFGRELPSVKPKDTGKTSPTGEVQQRRLDITQRKS